MSVHWRDHKPVPRADNLPHGGKLPETPVSKRGKRRAEKKGKK